MSDPNYQPSSRPNPARKRFIVRVIIVNTAIVAVTIGLPILRAFSQNKVSALFDMETMQQFSPYLLFVGGILLIISAVIFSGGSSDPRTGTISDKGGSYIPFTKSEEISRLNNDTQKDTSDAIRHALYTFPSAIILLSLAILLYGLQQLIG